MPAEVTDAAAFLLRRMHADIVRLRELIEASAVRTEAGRQRCRQLVVGIEADARLVNRIEADLRRLAGKGRQT